MAKKQQDKRAASVDEEPGWDEEETNEGRLAANSEEAWEVNQAYSAANRSPHPYKELTLPELTDRANELHAKVLQSVRTTLVAAKDCGIVLALIKLKVGHGKWVPWLKENFPASDYTAQRYMRIARDWHFLEALGWLDGSDLPGIAAADDIIRDLHGGQKIPSGNKPPPPTRQARVKYVTGTIKKMVEAWPDEAIELFEDQILPVMDSIEVYVQEQFGEGQYPDNLPRIAIRENVGQMALIRTFADRMGEFNEEEQAQLLQLLNKPGALKEAAKGNGTPPPNG